MRGLIDHKGECFAYVEGDQLYTLEGELAGYLRGRLIVDLAEQPTWRVIGDGVFMLDYTPIGYLSTEKPTSYDL